MGREYFRAALPQCLIHCSAGLAVLLHGNTEAIHWQGLRILIEGLHDFVPGIRLRGVNPHGNIELAHDAGGFGSAYHDPSTSQCCEKLLAWSDGFGGVNQGARAHSGHEDDDIVITTEDATNQFQLVFVWRVGDLPR